ncbi:MAG: ABC transporter permease [Desulfobacteraceae bacterium]|nr:ABC transporter permease [Desulfobacteraceae bacterium]
MIVFILRRLWQSFFVLLTMSVIVFVGVYAIGNPVDILISPEADQIEIDRATKALGLDKPLYEQYFIFLKNALKGDLGSSFVYNEPALKVILQRMPATLELAFSAMLFSVFLGIPLGMYAGLKSESIIGRTIMSGSILGFSLPTFWVGLMLIMLFAVILGWLPSGGRGETVEILGIQISFLSLSGLKHLFLPALNLALFKLSLTIRLARSGVRECMVMDYIKFAKAKGLSKSRIIGVHLLKNILIPVITVLGLELGGLIAFAVVTETVFAWPGMGKLIIDSIGVLDRPIIVAYLLIISLMFVMINFLVDIMYSVLDPRVRLQDFKS